MTLDIELSIRKAKGCVVLGAVMLKMLKKRPGISNFAKNDFTWI
jgi:hypothetical protein